MDVSIIIISFNTKELLSQCIKSVLKQRGNLSTEIIVVDNNSKDGSVEMLESSFPMVQIIKNKTNRGFAAANNQAMAAAKGEFVLLINPDTIVLDRAIPKAVAFAQSRPEAAVVGCKVLNPDGTTQPTCFMFPSVLNLILSSTYLYKLFPGNRFFGREKMTWWNRETIQQVDVVSGCFMLVRREAIKQVGMMDEDFFFYAEETDWCYRFKKKGWKLLFTPEAQIIHYWGASSSVRGVEMKLQLRGSILLFIKKHKNRAAYILSCILMAMFFFLRIPFWLIRWILSAEKSEYAHAVLKAYVNGTVRSLGGAEHLCTD